MKDGWWAIGASTPDCAAADLIIVGEDEAVTGKNFQLSHKNALPGDVNRDGEVSLSDAICALQLVTGQEKHVMSTAGDVDKNYKIDLSDVIYILAESALLGN